MTAHACNECGAEPHTEHTRGCRYNPVNMEAARAVGDLPYRKAVELYRRDAERRGDAVAPYYTGRATELLTRGGYDPRDVDFVLRVLAEVTKARAKFGGQPSLVTGLALAEELSEVDLAVALGATKPIKKLLHIQEGKSGDDDLYVECVQTAAMSLRLATENADRATWAGNVKRGCGGSYEVGSGGHVPGVAGEGCAACDRDFGPDPATHFKRRTD